MKPKVIVTETLDDRCARWLADRTELVWCSHDQPDFRNQLADAHGLVVRTYTQVDESLLEAAPRLQVVGRAGVGLDNVDVAACTARKVAVVYTPDANTQAVVEYVLALMLDALRPRQELTDAGSARFHNLRKRCVGTQLERLTLGVIGFGRIGKRVGEVARAIGINLLVNDVLPESQLRKQVEYAYSYVPKDELYARCDIITLHVDGRAENHHLIDAGALRQLKRDCLLINTSRGFVIDPHALRDWALSVRESGGRAVLDVHEPEPPPADYPLWGLDNVRLLPHLASRTDPALENMSWVVRDVWAVLNGDPPKHPAPAPGPAAAAAPAPGGSALRH